MKCVICHQNAFWIYSGYSVCAGHYMMLTLRDLQYDVEDVIRTWIEDHNKREQEKKKK